MELCPEEFFFLFKILAPALGRWLPDVDRRNLNHHEK